MQKEIRKFTHNVTSVSQLIHSESFVKKANDVLGEDTRQFLSSVLSLSNSSPELQKCDPIRLYNVCLMSAAIRLPFNQNLGQAYIVAYKTRGGEYEPQLQIGYKGFIQLAQRSGQFKTINCTDVREGEIKKIDRLTGKIEFEWIKDDAEREKAPIIGYVAFFELSNGFQKMLYKTKAELESHAKRYSQSYKRGYGVWKDNFDAMARKTVIKLVLSRYAPLSIDMQKAMELDQAGAGKEYLDNRQEFEVVDATLGKSEEDRTALVEKEGKNG